MKLDAFRRTSAGIGTAAVIVMACGTKRPPVLMQMAEHFSESRGIYTAVVYGDLELARESARQLEASPPSEDLPPESEALAEALRLAARSAAGASSLESMAVATGPVAQRCVACHQEYGVYRRLEPAPEPSARPDLAAHMARHRWALDRLWEGLVTGSDEGWASGLEALREPPADFETRGGTTAYRLGRRVHELGSEGANAPTASARAAVFGQLLEACVACHEL